MANSTAELSSLASAVEELTKRITALADDAAASTDDSTSTELFEIERALRAAHRRLTKLTNA